MVPPLRVSSIPRRRLRTTLIAAGVTLLVAAGCASTGARKAGDETSPEIERLVQLSLDRWLAHEMRLQLVAQKLQVSGADLCGKDVGPVLGLAVTSRDSVPQILAKAAEKRYPDEHLRVTAVFPGMAAERAGLRPDDVLLTVAGAAAKSAFAVYLPKRVDAETVAVRVARAGQELELQIPVTRGCAYPAVLYPGDELNAFSSTRQRFAAFPTTLLRELERDEQLAFVVGHELGHIIMARVHPAFRNSYETENQADYVGVYLTVRAGFAFDAADVSVFDVITLGDVNGIDRRTATHPVTPARTFALRETLREIEQKRSSGVALLPSDRSLLER